MIQWGCGLYDDKIRCDSSSQMLNKFFADILEMPSPVIWFGHFAQYDWRYMMDCILESGLKFEIGMRTDNDVYEIRIKNEAGKWVIMRDSFALWNSSLEKLAESFCPEIPKLKIDIENFDPKNLDHINYAKRDIEILLTGLPRLNDKLKLHYGININATTASTALKAWQYTLPENKYFDTSVLDEREIFVREAYYGGIVFLTNTKLHHGCKTYDLNSSYPDVMQKYGVPYGRIMESSDYCDEKMGIYKCRVKAPDNLIIPIIPARNSKGSMRWYEGEFDTVCTNRELIFAANHGYKIIKIYCGIVYEDVVFPFNDFIDKCKTIRREFKGQSEEKLAKLMQNSLYGKFGSKRERTKIYPRAALTDIDLLNMLPYGDDGKWYLKKECDEKGKCLPQWAVFITAHARLKLLQAVYSVGIENVIYGDTDSITIMDGHESSLDIGDEYGQFKLEKDWREFRAIAPKVYSGVLQSGIFTGAAKGLPSKNLSKENWQDLLENGTTSAQALSLESLRVTLKNGVHPAEYLMRRSSRLENSQNYNMLTGDNVSLKMHA